MIIEKLVPSLTVLSLCLIFFQSGSLVAQETEAPAPLTLEERDENLLRMLEQERAKGRAGKGVILIDAALRGLCDVVAITVYRMVDGKPEPHRIAGTPYSGAGKATFGRVKTVPAGDYVVAGVTCHSQRNNFTHTGPHARFQVRGGEFVDVGTLRLSHTEDPGFFASTGTSQRSVIPTSPERLADFKSKLPRSMRMLVTRPMTLIGPAESKTQMKWR